jgi:hypothetical protein
MPRFRQLRHDGCSASHFSLCERHQLQAVDCLGCFADTALLGSITLCHVVVEGDSSADLVSAGVDLVRHGSGKFLIGLHISQDYEGSERRIDDRGKHRGLVHHKVQRHAAFMYRCTYICLQRTRGGILRAAKAWHNSSRSLSF